MAYGQEVRWVIPGRKRRVLALTDLHFCSRNVGCKVDMILERLCEFCRAEQIEYIFVLGDLINSLEVLRDGRTRAGVERFLQDLAELAPVLMITGNHDITYYDLGPHRGVMRAAEWQQWAKSLMRRNQRIRLLDAALGKEKEIFDDGMMRVLGMSLPEKCYTMVSKREQASAKTFQAYARRVLPELTRVKDREYYLLVHTPQFLNQVELDPRIVVLAGHMHNGMLPPLLDGITRFSDRGLVGPGYYNQRGRKVRLIPFASGARYRPRPERPWLTVNSCIHWPAESWLRVLDGVYPQLSYVVIEDGLKMSVTSQYFWLKL